MEKYFFKCSCERCATDKLDGFYSARIGKQIGEGVIKNADFTELMSCITDSKPCESPLISMISSFGLPDSILNLRELGKRPLLNYGYFRSISRLLNEQWLPNQLWTKIAIGSWYIYVVYRFIYGENNPLTCLQLHLTTKALFNLSALHTLPAAESLKIDTVIKSLLIRANKSLLILYGKDRYSKSGLQSELEIIENQLSVS